MRIGKSILSLVLVLALAGLLAPPADLGAQTCATTGAPYKGTYTTSMGMSAYYVIKYLTTSRTCTLTMSMNVIDCAPSTMGGGGTVLSATALTAAVSPSCGWNCGGCGVVVDQNDGLPVELMDFEVEDSGAR